MSNGLVLDAGGGSKQFFFGWASVKVFAFPMNERGPTDGTFMLQASGLQAQASAYETQHLAASGKRR